MSYLKIQDLARRNRINHMNEAVKYKYVQFISPISDFINK